METSTFYSIKGARILHYDYLFTELTPDEQGLVSVFNDGDPMKPCIQVIDVFPVNERDPTPPLGELYKKKDLDFKSQNEKKGCGHYKI